MINTQLPTVGLDAGMGSNVTIQICLRVVQDIVSVTNLRQSPITEFVLYQISFTPLHGYTYINGGAVA